MPSVIVVAGPNGAGKTSFANRYLPAAGANLTYVNADEIAREPFVLSLPAARRDAAAGREMLKRLGQLAAAGADFMYETTLASRAYAPRWRLWRQNGYRIELVYLRLAHVDDAISRVARRVKNGGHAVPEAIIRRRFALSATYLDALYKPLCDVYSIWNSLEGDFELVERWPNP